MTGGPTSRARTHAFPHTRWSVVVAATRKPSPEERKTGPVIWGQRCLFAKVENARWETIKSARVVKELLRGGDVRTQAELPNRQAIPATFLFKTRQGGRGVLQVVGFTEDLRGMKLRYKLVQP